MDPIEKLVTFCILMENNQGILGKAPSYIKEKFMLCETATTREHLMQLLDQFNLDKFRRWLLFWGAHLK